MSERFYKIGNTWYPWQTAHGLYGYTKTPTIRITYISTSQATWGQPESGYGFFDGDASEPQDGSYFHTSTWGWFDADSMAKTIWLMPSECEIDDIFFENDGEISPGARLIIDPSVSIDEEDWRYLIASVRNLGWHTLDEWEELGWVPSDPNTLYFGGDFSGNNIRMESVDGGGGLIDKYASYKALFKLRGWEPGGLFIDKPRMMEICGVLTETSDSVVLVEVPKQLSVGRIEFTGSLAEGGIPESGVVEEYDPRPSIEINLGIRFDPSNAQWLAKTFDADEWWWSGILSSSDLSVLRNFGCGYLQTNNVSYAFAGNIGAFKYEGEKYEYKLLSMFGEVGSSPVAFDRSNFFFKRLYSDGNSSQYNGALLINSINAFATAVKSYRIKIIDKDPGAIYVLCGFKYSSGSWIQITFAGVGDYFWAGIIYVDDQAKLQELGLISDTSYPHDEILYSNAYNYEVVAMYSDMGVTSVQFDPSNFYVDKATSYPCISIFSRAAFSTPVMTWVCRITRKPAPVLPTVETNLSAYGTLQSGTKNLAPNDIGVLYLRNEATTAVIYDDNYLYSVYRYYYDVLGASEWRIGAFFEAVKDGTTLAAKNITNSTIQYIGLYSYATCSDNQAEVVKVLNSSNESFNAFKFTANGTDYYYVLDNTQTDWTDDLESIGYHLPPVNLIGYMTEGKAAVTVRTGSPRKLYDESGNLIPFDSTLQYTMICYYSYDGGDPIPKPAQMGFTNVEGSLGLFATNSRSFTVQRVEYTES